jgi:hypothetical protein
MFHISKLGNTHFVPFGKSLNVLYLTSMFFQQTWSNKQFKVSEITLVITYKLMIIKICAEFTNIL